MILIPSNLKCIIIDWDGTLTSAKGMVHEAYVRTMKSLGINRLWTMEDTQARNGQDPRVIFADTSLWGDKCAQAKETFYQHYRQIAVEQPELLSLKPGATELLSFLKEALPETKIVLLAAKTEELLKDEVAQFGMTDAFDMIVGKRDNGPNKPQPEVIDYITEQLGISVTDSKRQLLHIADNPVADVQFSKDCKMPLILVNKNGSVKDLVQLRSEILVKIPRRTNSNSSENTQIHIKE